MIFNTQLTKVQKAPEYFLNSITLRVKRTGSSINSYKINYIQNSAVPEYTETDGIAYSDYPITTGSSLAAYTCDINTTNTYIHGNIPNGRYNVGLYKIDTASATDLIGGSLVFDYTDGDITIVTNNIHIRTAAASSSNYASHLCMIGSLSYTPPS